MLLIPNITYERKVGTLIRLLACVWIVQKCYNVSRSIILLMVFQNWAKAISYSISTEAQDKDDLAFYKSNQDD